MTVETIEDISVKIPMTADLRERWEKFTWERGYGKGPFLRSFVEAITDPIRGPQIEQIIQSRETATEASA